MRKRLPIEGGGSAKKPKYETPTVVWLGGLAKGSGVCKTGSGYVAGQCWPGNQAGGDCYDGGQTDAGCYVGSTAATDCNPGVSAATSYCYDGVAGIT